jgi:hypothetical protein
VAAGATIGASAAIRTIASEYQEAAKVGAQTNAVLKSTGGVANVTAKQVGDLSTAISAKTGIDDEQIQSSANLLLTFTKVRNEAGRGNDIFSQATRTITDMSVALGQTGKASAVQLGKALNDPIKGITALSRVGVSFTKQQKAQITTLVNSGQTLKAQKIILRELNTEFGGSAKAAATPIDLLKTNVNNLAESLGMMAAPTVNKGIKALATFVGQMSSGTGAGGKFVRTVKQIGSTIKATVGPPLVATVKALKAFINGMREGTGAGGKFAAAMVSVYDAGKSTVGAIRNLVAGFRAGKTWAVLATAAIASLAAGITTALVVTKLTKAFKAARAAVKAARAAVIGFNIALAANPVGLVVVAIAALAAGAYVAYRKFATFRRIVNGAFGALKSIASWVRSHWKVVLVGLTGPLGAAALLVASNFGRIKRAVGSAVSFILRRLDDILGGFSSVISVGSKIPGLGGKFKDAARGIDKARDSLRATADNLDGVKRKAAGGIDIPITVNGQVPSTGIGFIDAALSDAAASTITPAATPVRTPSRPSTSRPSSRPTGARRPSYRASGALAPSLASGYDKPIVVEVSTMLDGRVLHKGVHRVERALAEQS